MSPDRQAKITTALASCPDGTATAIELAKVLNWKDTAASLYLGMLYFGQIVDREKASENKGSRQYRYRLKPKAEAPVTRGPWQPATVRVARVHPRAHIIKALAVQADALSAEADRLLERVEQ